MSTPRSELLLLVAALSLVACDETTTPDAGDDDAGATGDAGPGVDAGPDVDAGPPTAGDAGPLRDAGPPPSGDDPIPRGSYVGSAPATTLPAAATLRLRGGSVLADSASFDVFPVEGALDYRIYPLPADGDVVDDGGSQHVRNGTYRCAGQRFNHPIASDGDPTELNHLFAVTTVVRGEVEGFDRSAVEPTLGYVALAPGAGLEPLFAMGSPHPEADHGGESLRMPETRAKRYVVGDAARLAMREAGWRDDGLIGWVPAEGAGAHAVSVFADALGANEAHGAILYFADAAEGAVRGGSNIEFYAFDEAADGRAPIGRVHFEKWGTGHDELVVGAERLSQIQRMGAIPHLSVQWPNTTAGQVLVIEALDARCPFQGNPLADDGSSYSPDSTLPAEALDTAAIRAAASHGELFLNGQGGPGNPGVLARAFVEVTPGVSDVVWDWAEDFSSPGFWVGVDSETERWMSPVWTASAGTVHFQSVDAAHFGIQDGELWMTLMDVAADVNGKFRITPEVTVDLTETAYAHATMTVDTFATDRRYPQVFFSDARVDRPIQASPNGATGQNLAAGAGILVQVFGGEPSAIEVQYCDGREWDVNNQCPHVELEVPEDSFADPWPAAYPLEARASNVYRNRFDVFASTGRVYVFVDGAPYGCAELPSAFSYQAGPSHVTFGHVLYHSGVDVEGDVYPFHRASQHTLSRRHFDNLGLRGDAEVPSWPASLACRSDWIGG